MWEWEYRGRPFSLSSLSHKSLFFGEGESGVAVFLQSSSSYSTTQIRLFPSLFFVEMTRNSPQDLIKMDIARDYLEESIDKDPDPILTPLIKHGMKAGVKKVPQGCYYNKLYNRQPSDIVLNEYDTPER